MRPDCTLNNATKPPQTTKNVRLPFLYCFLTRGATARETKLKRTTAQTKENIFHSPTDARQTRRRCCNPPTVQKKTPEKTRKRTTPNLNHFTNLKSTGIGGNGWKCPLRHYLTTFFNDPYPRSNRPKTKKPHIKNLNFCRTFIRVQAPTYYDKPRGAGV